jgi:hypothetical protein
MIELVRIGYVRAVVAGKRYAVTVIGQLECGARDYLKDALAVRAPPVCRAGISTRPAVVVVGVGIGTIGVPAGCLA